MKNAIKYIYPASPFYVHWKKHICPKRGGKVELQYVSKNCKFKIPRSKG